MTEQIAHLIEGQDEIKAGMKSIDAKVSNHDDQLRDWRKVGRVAAWAFAGIGAVITASAHQIWDWLSRFVPPPHS